jgi:hypothetical protein
VHAPAGVQRYPHSSDHVPMALKYDHLWHQNDLANNESESLAGSAPGSPAMDGALSGALRSPAPALLLPQAAQPVETAAQQPLPVEAHASPAAAAAADMQEAPLQPVFSAASIKSSCASGTGPASARDTLFSPPSSTNSNRPTPAQPFSTPQRQAEQAAALAAPHSGFQPSTPGSAGSAGSNHGDGPLLPEIRTPARQLSTISSNRSAQLHESSEGEEDVQQQEQQEGSGNASPHTDGPRTLFSAELTAAVAPQAPGGPQAPLAAAVDYTNAGLTQPQRSSSPDSRRGPRSGGLVSRTLSSLSGLVRKITSPARADTEGPSALRSSHASSNNESWPYLPTSPPASPGQGGPGGPASPAGGARQGAGSGVVPQGSASRARLRQASSSWPDIQVHPEQGPAGPEAAAAAGSGRGSEWGPLWGFAARETMPRSSGTKDSSAAPAAAAAAAAYLSYQALNTQSAAAAAASTEHAAAGQAPAGNWDQVWDFAGRSLEGLPSSLPAPGQLVMPGVAELAPSPEPSQPLPGFRTVQQLEKEQMMRRPLGYHKNAVVAAAAHPDTLLAEASDSIAAASVASAAASEEQAQAVAASRQRLIDLGMQHIQQRQQAGRWRSARHSGAAPAAPAPAAAAGAAARRPPSASTSSPVLRMGRGALARTGSSGSPCLEAGSSSDDEDNEEGLRPVLQLPSEYPAMCHASWSAAFQTPALQGVSGQGIDMTSHTAAVYSNSAHVYMAWLTLLEVAAARASSASDVLAQPLRCFSC